MNKPNNNASGSETPTASFVPLLGMGETINLTPPELPEPIIVQPRAGNSKFHLYECPRGVKGPHRPC